MISHRCRYKARGSVLMRVFTSSSVRWVAARVTLAISSLFSFQSSPPLFYHSTRISITQADLSGAYLNSVNLSEAIVENTSFGDRDLRVIKGIETIRHHGPSPLSINTIYLSGGDIPESFLQGTGAPDTFIEYVRALVNRPIEYYTCFISYSNKDKDLAERLYRDLQAKGVRCWF